MKIVTKTAKKTFALSLFAAALFSSSAQAYTSTYTAPSSDFTSFVNHTINSGHGAGYAGGAYKVLPSRSYLTPIKHVMTVPTHIKTIQHKVVYEAPIQPNLKCKKVKVLHGCEWVIKKICKPVW